MINPLTASPYDPEALMGQAFKALEARTVAQTEARARGIFGAAFQAMDHQITAEMAKIEGKMSSLLSRISGMDSQIAGARKKIARSAARLTSMQQQITSLERAQTNKQKNNLRKHPAWHEFFTQKKCYQAFLKSGEKATDETLLSVGKLCLEYIRTNPTFPSPAKLSQIEEEGRWYLELAVEEFKSREAAKSLKLSYRGDKKQLERTSGLLEKTVPSWETAIDLEAVARRFELPSSLQLPITRAQLDCWKKDGNFFLLLVHSYHQLRSVRSRHPRPSQEFPPLSRLSSWKVLTEEQQRYAKKKYIEWTSQGPCKQTDNVFCLQLASLRFNPPLCRGDDRRPNPKWGEWADKGIDVLWKHREAVFRLTHSYTSTNSLDPEVSKELEKVGAPPKWHYGKRIHSIKNRLQTKAKAEKESFSQGELLAYISFAYFEICPASQKCQALARAYLKEAARLGDAPSTEALRTLEAAESSSEGEGSEGGRGGGSGESAPLYEGCKESIEGLLELSEREANKDNSHRPSESYRPSGGVSPSLERPDATPPPAKRRRRHPHVFDDDS